VVHDDHTRVQFSTVTGETPNGDVGDAADAGTEPGPNIRRRWTRS
jgi:hypothetical protein